VISVFDPPLTSAETHDADGAYPAPRPVPMGRPPHPDLSADAGRGEVVGAGGFLMTMSELETVLGKTRRPSARTAQPALRSNDAVPLLARGTVVVVVAAARRI
jgi:hypothetical protein